MASKLSLWLLKLLGWSVHADYPQSKKYVIIAAPHTSNWDFPLGIIAQSALNLNIQWIGKHTLFRWPYGWFFRAIGGTPVYRHESLNLSQQLAARFASTEAMVLALAPEGTRKKTDHWKTGFYHIATAANVPIVMGYLDFGRKQVGIGKSFMPSGDIDSDFEIIREYYRDICGKNPQQTSSIQIRQAR